MSSVGRLAACKAPQGGIVSQPCFLEIDCSCDYRYFLERRQALLTASMMQSLLPPKSRDH